MITHKINDGIVRLISVPIIAAGFSSVSGLIDHSRYSAALLLVQYCYFICLVFLLWQGNILLVMFVKGKMNSDRISYARYISTIIMATFVYAWLLIAGLLLIWTKLFIENHTSSNTLLNATFILAFIATFITLIYENYLLNRKKISALSKVKQMNLAKNQAELSAFKSQVDPHFIFNSLNALSYLIASNPLNAQLYNNTLAKLYQYILMNNDKDLVLLREEIEFVRNYFYLISIRFENAIKMTIEITDFEAQDLLIPPISLQTLIENAVKHNEFNAANPLIISVSLSSNHLIVSNRINNKTFSVPTLKIGLSNLDNRYRLITNRNIAVDKNQFFTVKLPIINLYR